jgi:iron complex transport system substrate-binding protein
VTSNLYPRTSARAARLERACAARTGREAGFARFVAACLLAACAAVRAAPLEVHDDTGRVLHFEQPPQRIVSLLPSLTEAVCALGACAQLVGVDRYSNWPASVGALPKLGGLDDPGIERIAALRPELVLAARSARAVERLDALGIPVLMMDSQSHADVQRALALLGRVLGREAAAREAQARIERQFADAAARVPPAWRGRKVYFEVDSTPYAAGAASFIGQILARIGLANSVPASLGPFPKLNPEFVVRADPDVVMAPARELAAMAARPGWGGLRALKAAQVCGFDPVRYELLVRPGPRMGEAAIVIADCVRALPAPK